MTKSTIYVVLSRTQCECTVCHRWFATREAAADYARAAKAGTGCDLYVIAVASGDVP